ncbi:MAG: putative selenium-dependent hydroxylase accessory protein YqeC [Chloroflexi bacterium]|jgi:molybdenum cofactor cytidylyltransferase|nr:putative selenium-dependent hydroxylase accessory protein YqeC [Chloroflexota bacterium]MBT3670781.1 putative selenium-dependent hydroxylase accessory protein YqeC [Chloroflexota bacterium]MBT4004387.1 putative selenium-dependent hydroxylase accessory protein YqeC [Chloroflexota bacterium]MBT4305149.1 putative selenium-dependent hydroxylase accessory protein YqeC [Chloroflexota bacterium]MBT4533329.1 putative selenium-dependent hydroxylase accessory protein YqeC [Chloroflexota bacterium]
MQLIDGIRIDKNSRVAFVGAGGKSTSMFRLAQQYQGKCILSTSTHLALAQVKLADQHIIVGNIADLDQLHNDLPDGITLISGPKWRNDRVGALSDEIFQELDQLAAKHQVPILIEADGSRRLPLKSPGNHEPAIPPIVNTVVVLVGFSGLGMPLNEKNVHRPELFSKRTGLEMGELIEKKHLLDLVLHPEGGLKNIKEGMKKVLFLNQADTNSLVTIASSMSPAILKKYDQVVVGSLNKMNDEIHIRHHRVAGIVLAAGGSERLGEPKQLLDWKGTPFIRAVVMKAIAAGLDQVVVVTGAFSEKTSKAVQGLPVKIIHNENWSEGQSTSVKKGIESLDQNIGAAVFLLVDQPQVSSTLIKKLIETYSISKEPIIGTLVDGQRGNPVLFDRSTFADLGNIQGDKGGRQIFSKYPVRWMPWLDQIMALDVDNPGDYEKLLNFKEQK